MINLSYCQNRKIAQFPEALAGAGGPQVVLSVAKQIISMVGDIQPETRSAVESMQQGKQQVEEGVATTAQAGESLARIVSTVERVSSMTEQIVTSSKKQETATEEVQSSVQKIAGLVQQTFDSTMATDCACQILTQLSSTLQSALAKFQI